MDIDETEADTIRERMDAQLCTEEHRLRWEKHYFQNRIVRDYGALVQQVPFEDIAKMFIDFRKQHGAIMQKRYNKEAERNGKGDYKNIFHGNQAKQLAVVQRLCGILGIPTSTTLGALIPRATLNVAAEAILRAKPELVETFGLRVREDATKQQKSSVERATKLVNQVLGVWGHTKIAPATRQQRRFGATTTPYTVQGDLFAHYT